MNLLKGKGFFRISMACAAMAACASSSLAQVAETNPLCIAAITEGYAVITQGINGSTSNQQETALLQNTIAAEYTMMKSWQSSYNAYLKTAQGYGTTLKASMSLYSEGVRTIEYLWQLKKAVASNPSGVVATLSMNNLYVETAAAFLKVYSLLENTIAKGGEQNMLNGTERTQMLWNANDELELLNRKLRQLLISVSYHTLSDVWTKATSGIIDRNKKQVAGEALKRWKRAAKTKVSE